MKYSVDSNVFINMGRHYPPDVFPSVWNWIESLIANKELQAICEVKGELEKGTDAVVDWAKSQVDLFVPLDTDVQISVTDIMSKYPNLVNPSSPHAKSQTDPFVIALAKVNNCTVVSGENRTGNINGPKIPDVCDDLGIPSITFFDLARAEGRRF